MYSHLFWFKSEPIKQGHLASDIFYINNISNNSKNIGYEMRFLLYRRNLDNNIFEGIIGLGVNNYFNYLYPGYNFINQLKNNMIINEFTFFLKIGITKVI